LIFFWKKKNAFGDIQKDFEKKRYFFFCLEKASDSRKTVPLPHKEQ
jgi:hypothetical protein